MATQNIEYIIKKGVGEVLRPVVVHWLTQVDHILKANSKVQKLDSMVFPLVRRTKEKTNAEDVSVLLLYTS